MSILVACTFHGPKKSESSVEREGRKWSNIKHIWLGVVGWEKSDPVEYVQRQASFYYGASWRRVEFILCTHEAFILVGSVLWHENVSLPRRARILFQASESEKFFTTNANFFLSKSFFKWKSSRKMGEILNLQCEAGIKACWCGKPERLYRIIAHFYMRKWKCLTLLCCKIAAKFKWAFFRWLHSMVAEYWTMLLLG